MQLDQAKRDRLAGTIAALPKERQGLLIRDTEIGGCGRGFFALRYRSITAD